LGINALTLLATGQFNGAKVVYFFDQGIYSYEIAGTSFYDTKDNCLESALGIATDTEWSGNFQLSFYLSGTGYVPPGGFDTSPDGVFGSGNFFNNVPLPPTALLLGTGLLGLVGFRFRGRKKG
jgi:hypothetical protein